METKLFNKLPRFTEDEKIAFRKKAIIFSFFLVLSVVFWLVNALSKTYEATINYPVKYIDIPEGKVLVSDTPDYLILKVSSHGYNILRHKLSARIIPITFSVNSFALNVLPGDDKDVYFIQTRFSREQLSRQLSSEFNITDIRPDTLFFRFASIVTKKLPVKPDVSFEPDKQMIIKGLPSSNPDSVLVSGPNFILDTLQAITTRYRKLGVLSQTFEGTIDLRKTDNLTIEQEKVIVSVGIERITEKMLMVPVEIINIPDSLTAKTFPAAIEVFCHVGLSKFPELEPSAFRVIVNFEEASKGSGKLSVQLVKSPEFVRAVKYSPKTVEFLIEK